MHKTTRDYRGQQYVLWAVTYSSAATQDGAGRIQGGYVVQQEYAAVVTEQHLTTDPHGSGLVLIATTEAGEKFRHDGRWWRDDEDRTPYVDISDALEVSDEVYRYGMQAHVDESGNPAVPSGTEFCLFHGNYYLLADGCRKCALDREFQLGKEGEGPLYYLPCPFCEQMRSGSHEEDQHWHLKWAHAGQLARRGVKQGGQHKHRFRDFVEEEVPIAS